MSEPRVHVRHMRALGYCLRGCRAFYAAHGLDWRRCLHEGTPGEQLAATGDAMALKLLDLARREAGR
ncbi:MAG: hypothetical protein ACEB74_13960 [Desulfovibrio aminophilus]|uniref:hypothetical protein n=1 Tax=Desulfovibrio aminophilus TaxID=81425 RepID=UPI0039E8FDB8